MSDEELDVAVNLDGGPGADIDPNSSFFRFTTTRPVAVSMVVLAVVVFGLVGLGKLPVTLLPDISYPTITIRTEYPGASPEDVEKRVSERIEEQVAVVQGVRKMTSISRAEVSDVVLEFLWGTEMVFAISDVRERLDRVRLPEDADRPLVLRYDPSLDPVMTIGLSGEAGSVELRRIAEEEVERELAKVEGVAAVKVRGGDEEEIRISIDEGALAVLGIEIDRIATRLREENVNAAAGVIEEGKTEFLVRALGEFRNLDEVRDVIIEHRGGGGIRLRDLAIVERLPKDKEVISRVNGKPCVLVDVFKEASANVVAMAAQVRERAFGTAGQQAYLHALAQERSTQPSATGSPDTSESKQDDGASGGDDIVTDEDAEQADDDLAKAEKRRKEHHRTMTDFLAAELGTFEVEVELLQDQSEFIETSIDEVRSSAVFGGLFAILVILLFLRRLSATLILAISIPISVAASFAPMFLSEISLNVMSLGGLALGVGMLVDNSIVVLESITRAREEGLGLRAAAIVGVSRVASAVVASTLTTIAVFFPIVFVQGIGGQLFRDQSLTVVYSLIMSLFVALFLIPMLASRGRDRDTSAAPTTPRSAVPQTRAGDLAASLIAAPLRGIAILFGAVLRVLAKIAKPVAWSFDYAYRALERAYSPLLRGALRLRWIVLLIAALLLALSARQAGTLGNELLPEVAQGEVYVDVFLPRDATVERTAAVVGPLERRVAALPTVERTFLAVGVDKQELNSSEEGEHSARILVTLATGSGDLAATEERLRGAVRELIRAVPAIESYRFARPSVLSFAAPLVVEVMGRDLYALRNVSNSVVEALREIPGLRDVRSTLQRGNPEIVLRLDREKMAALGVDSGAVSDVLRNKVQGDVPTRFAERERKVDIRVGIAKEDLRTVSDLLDINVNPMGNPVIPLGSIAAVRRLEGPSEIRRIGTLRGAEVRATVAGFDIGSSQTRVADAIRDVPRPSGIDVRVGGQKEEMAQSIRGLTMALLFAVFLVYVVMASQFENLVQPLMILCSLPLALVGVVFTLSFLDVPVSVVVLLGAIVLAGIVVNNAIIMIDQINRLRVHTGKFDAIVEGARNRLRPVLMTTTTTVLGLLPLTGWLQGLPILGGTGEGLELRAPLAITVIAGLISSTLLTLIVIPVVYSIVDRKP